MQSHGFDVAAHTRQWVEAGLIDEAQAAGIIAFETRDEAASPAPARPTVSHVPVVVEILGYLGTAIAIVAGIVAVRQAWPDMPAGAGIGLAMCGAALLFGAGAQVPAGPLTGRRRQSGETAPEPAVRRLRSALWAGSTGCLAAAAALFGDGVLHLAPSGTACLASGTAIAEALTLWAVSEYAVQHVALFAAVAVAVGTGVAQIASQSQAWGPGLAVWTLSSGWAVAAHRGWLAPRNTGYLVAAIGMLTGAQLTMQTAAGHVLAATTVAAVLAAGVRLRRVWLVGIGAYGVIQFVPQTASRYLPGVVAAPLAVFAVGLVLVLAAIWLSRNTRPPRSNGPLR